MQGYIISVLGIVMVSIMVEIILPSGDTAKYIKSIVAIFIVYIIINPVIGFFKSDFNISKYVNNSNISVNEKLLQSMFYKKIEVKESELELRLKEKGYENVELDISFEIIDNDMKINTIIVNIDELVITCPNENINKYEAIRQVVLESILVKEEDIIFE